MDYLVRQARILRKTIKQAPIALRQAIEAAPCSFTIPGMCDGGSGHLVYHQGGMFYIPASACKPCAERMYSLWLRPGSQGEADYRTQGAIALTWDGLWKAGKVGLV